MMSISGMFQEKKRYRQYKARMQELPPGYRETVGALERYLMVTGPGDGANLLAMLEDLADLFEQSVADGTPIAGIVGEDVVEFAEAFQRNYPRGQWITKERKKLADAVREAQKSGGAP
ncbi:DUF1048 domain-containing protein [Nakamurella sp. YIM 132087]|uniref:DUF1048 domain-containing protein n=1 Tax=Nakamurella alba TaxID=2665158 RepID=A0A7K1FPC7_9ACTN|nr:DUF1048 domain-containing protein [Nakamurella alba]MTD16005.1 DUF1048 domain-containing protein [Nakamurella alba]